MSTTKADAWRRIAKAAKVTDTVTEGFLHAQRALQQTCWVNGHGVLDDRSMVISDLHRAKDGIDKALAAIRGFSEWPTKEDYDNA